MNVVTLRVIVAGVLSSLAFATFSVSGSPSAGVPAAEINFAGEVSLATALEILQKSGNPLLDLRASQGEETSNPTVRVDWKNVPFWKALDELAGLAKLRVVPFTHPETRKPAIGLLNRDAANSDVQVSYDGPFRITLKRIAAAPPDNAAALSTMTATLELAYEPRLQPLLLRLGRDSIKCTGPDGKLMRAEQGGSGDIKLVGEQPVEITVKLPRPERNQIVLKELNCEFTALVPPNWVEFTGVKLASAERVEKENVAATFRYARTMGNPRESALTVHLEYPAGRMPLESHQTWAMEHLELYLQNPKQPSMKPVGNPEIAVDEGRAIRITYRFRNVGDPAGWTATYRVPAVPVRTPVRAVFRNVPLP